MSPAALLQFRTALKDHPSSRGFPQEDWLMLLQQLHHHSTSPSAQSCCLQPSQVLVLTSLPGELSSPSLFPEETDLQQLMFAGCLTRGVHSINYFQGSCSSQVYPTAMPHHLGAYCALGYLCFIRIQQSHVLHPQGEDLVKSWLVMGQCLSSPGWGRGACNLHQVGHRASLILEETQSHHVGSCPQPQT